MRMIRQETDRLQTTSWAPANQIAEEAARLRRQAMITAARTLTGALRDGWHGLMTFGRPPRSA